MRAATQLILATAFCFALTGVSEAREPKRQKVTEDAVIGACDEGLQENTAEGVKGCTIGCKGGGKQAICDYSCGGPEGSGCRKYVFTRVESYKPGRGWIDRPKARLKKS